MAHIYIEKGPVPESLGKSDFTDLYLAFMDAFRDYQPRVQMTLAAFCRKFIDFYQTDPNLSSILWYKGRIAGFGLVSTGIVNGRNTAWVSALGVRSEYRKRGWSHFLVKHITDKARNWGMDQVSLEAQTRNESAIALFTSHNFAVNRKLVHYRLTEPRWIKVDQKKVSIKNYIDIPFDLSVTGKYVFTFQESISFIESEQKSHTTFIIKNSEDSPAGYLLMDSDTGRIRHIFVLPRERGQGYGTALIARACQMNKHLDMINVDTENIELCRFLGKMGFRIEMEQYEMILTL
ncbi:MAG: GNAT family N-acetyltransferase [Cyclobacteriaceae bacterium]